MVMGIAAVVNMSQEEEPNPTDPKTVLTLLWTKRVTARRVNPRFSISDSVIRLPDRENATISRRGHEANDLTAPLLREIAELRGLLWEQWEFNHAEHCGGPWPHPVNQGCYGPLPPILNAPSVVCLRPAPLADGSAEPRPQWLEDRSGHPRR